ncbi:unnamed protein product [Pleuronectes platessa]|uniref:Uncharacterized protein n=1 Tax=Pleuronectes platessa TaxID=8262 RepID=A0A9N7YYW2_PLEPL|nr:unnamed protein product [Pleuronectes platessa]
MYRNTPSLYFWRKYAPPPSLLRRPHRTRIHHPDQTPLQTSVTYHHRPPEPTAALVHRPYQCQRDTGSATSPTISPHDTESATLDPPPRPPVRDPQTAIHGAATDALDLREEIGSNQALSIWYGMVLQNGVIVFCWARAQRLITRHWSLGDRLRKSTRRQRSQTFFLTIPTTASQLIIPAEETMFHPVEEQDESVPIRPSRRRCNRGSSATELERPRSFTGLPKIRAPRASNTTKVTATDRHLVFDLMSSQGS